MSTVPGQSIIRPPAVEDLARRLIHGAGYQDAETIPTKIVIDMLISMAWYEHNWNVNLANMLNELKVLGYPAPTLRSDEFFEETT